MAQIFPDPISPDTKSAAERDLYQIFKNGLGDEFVVMHNIPWISRFQKSGARDGEADFIVAHPEHGILVVETKGGEIDLDQKTQTWTSTSRWGNVYKIKDPFHQARSAAYNLLGKLRDDASPTHRYYWPVHYAVAFPDVSLTQDLRPDAPRSIVIDYSNLLSIQDKICAIYRYWHGENPSPAYPGKAGMQSLINLLAPSWQLRSRLSMKFEREQAQIKDLTEQQFLALDLLARRRKATIVGGAGTGKTMLAVEKTRRLAEEGFRVLFVCYNRNLAEWIRQVLGEHENILVATFHGLCGMAAEWAEIPLSDGPFDQSFYDERLPDALMRAVDRMDRRFDAIVVDEGQDFRHGLWWLALEALLQDEENGIFYVFFDDNQRIYSELYNVPVSEEPFILNHNCRNTRAVHEALEPYSHAQYKTTCQGPPGRTPEIVFAAEGQARERLKHTLLNMVNQDGIDPSEIIILTPRSQAKSQWAEGERLAIFTLTWNLETEHKQAIRVCTIHSFKGLESPVVILTEMEAAKMDEIVYVGLSRARNHVCVIGELPDPGRELEEPDSG